MTALQQAFRELVMPLLESNPRIPHEWRDINDWWGGHLDLVCGVGSPHEVFASLTDSQITIGTVGGEDYDFEDFGRGSTAQVIAQEALERFVGVLTENGYLGPELDGNAK